MNKHYAPERISGFRIRRDMTEEAIPHDHMNPGFPFFDEKKCKCDYCTRHAIKWDQAGALLVSILKANRSPPLLAEEM